MKNRNIITITILLLFMSLNSCKTLKIERGRIEDVWSMNIINSYSHGKHPRTFYPAVKLLPNAFFNSRDLGLKCNKPVHAPSACVAAGYKNLKYTYSVVITNPVDKHEYYGQLALFSAKPWAADKAATTYYRITFDKFSDCIEGRTNFYYEYYEAGRTKIPTWILWVSNVPLK